jgi:hypothetical protein
VDLLVDEGGAVAPATMLEELLAVVPGDDDDRVLEQALGLEGVEHVRELLVQVMAGVQVAVPDPLDVALEGHRGVVQVLQPGAADHRLLGKRVAHSRHQRALYRYSFPMQ